MNKYISAFSLFLVLAILPGCTRNNNSVISDTTAPEETDASTTDKSTASDENAMFSDFVPTQQDVYELDNEFEEKKNKVSSNAELSNLEHEYADKWLQLAEEYYSAIIFCTEERKNGYTEEYGDDPELLAELTAREDGIQSYVNQMHSGWKERFETDCELYEKYLEAEYGMGTAQSGALALYKYECCRFYALQLYRIYQNNHYNTLEYGDMADDAVNIVKTMLSKETDISNLYFELDGKQTVDDVEYIRVHVYSVSQQDISYTDEITYQQRFTYGRFYVNSHTGNVYTEDIKTNSMILYM